MSKAIGGIVINEKESTPTSEYITDFLIGQNKECSYLDYKTTISTATDGDFPKIAKHMIAFANYGGGWLLIGFLEDKEKRFYHPDGLPSSYTVDQATLQEKFNSYSSEKLYIDYNEFKRTIDGQERSFAIVFVPPSKTIISTIKEGKYTVDGKVRKVFDKDEVFFRRGSQSIRPSKLEVEYITTRIKQENYRHSVLSGMPDLIEETLSSNLFPISTMPEHIYLGEKKPYDDVSIKVLLKQKGIFPEWIPKFREHCGNLVIFEDLENPDNPYRTLVNVSTIKRERIEGWLDQPDKRRVVISLLYKEFIHHAFKKGLFLFSKKGSADRYYFPCDSDKDDRTELWNSRYGGQQSRQVAKKSYATQLKQFVYYHHCFSPAIFEIQKGKAFLRINPSFIITENGKKAISSMQAGTFITRLQYKQYNDKYLNNLLFWVDKLSDNGKIDIAPYLKIDTEPLKVTVNKGILPDIPVTEIRYQIQSFEDADEEEDVSES